MTTQLSVPLFEEQVKYAGFWAGAWRRFRRNVLAMYGLVFVILIVILIFRPSGILGEVLAEEKV